MSTWYTRGSTRVAFLFPGVVVKIPLIRIRYFVRWISEVCTKGVTGSRIHQRHGSARAVLQHVLHAYGGIVANRIERTFTECSSSGDGIAPTFYTFFGYVAVQARCQQIQGDHPLWIAFRNGLPDDCHKMVDAIPRNYGLYQGRLVCLDYGRLDTQEFLAHEGGEKLRKINCIDLSRQGVPAC